MTNGTESRDDAFRSERDAAPASSLVDALLVYAEPLASGVHAVVVGDAQSSLAERLLELGARGVLVFDPDPARAAHASRTAARGVTVRALVDELDVRDGAFDLAVVPDLAELNDVRSTIARLQRAVSKSGAVLAMGRAKLADEDEQGEPPFPMDLGPATLAYDELYDAFAAEFDDVTLVGVVPFRGVVFAELGMEDEAPAVSVDTRLASAPPPSVFVVIASSAAPAQRHGRGTLDPYAIVQVPEEEQAPVVVEDTLALEAAFTAAKLQSDLLAAQLDEVRERLVVSDVRNVEAAARLDRAAAERDAALTRAMELEAVLAASQQTMAALERRLLEAEQGMLERDDRIAALSAELEAQRSAREASLAAAGHAVDISEIVTRAERAEEALARALADIAAREENAATHVDTRMTDISELVARAERAEAGLALQVADLAHVAEAHAAETAVYEEQLRDRARVIAALEKELVRREQLVKELVTSLEESREGTANGGITFEAAAPLSMPPPRPDPAVASEMARLRLKLDDLAGEVARREGELTARAWRITELEKELARLERAHEEARKAKPAARPMGTESADLGAELARAQDELDALRQALAQEHAARVAAESGEELARARSELARQAVLLEQMRGRVDNV